MKTLKKLFAFVGLLSLAFAFASCGETTPTVEETPTEGETPTEVVTPTEGEQTLMDQAIPAEFNGIATSNKTYLTCCGQADLDLAINILEAAGVTADKYTSNNLLNASEVEANSVVILIVGTSAKGLGSAGTNVTGEIARATEFVNKANANEITLVVVHLGGADRRGDVSDGVIKAAVPGADLFLVVDGGNNDGVFNTSAPLNIYSKKSKVATAFASLFA